VPDLDVDYGLEAIPDGALSRNRFLKGITAGLLGAAATVLTSSNPAYGHRSSPPSGCGPSGQCNCCHTSNGCCSPGCSVRYSGCAPTGYGWYICQGGQKYFCHDYWDSDNHRCICKIIVRTSC